MTRFFIYAYNNGSKGAKALARALGGRIILHNRSKYVPHSGDVIINWGSHHLPDNFNSVRGIRIFNRPNRVAINADKLSCFRHWNGAASVPSWTVDKKVAQSWKSTVAVRHITNGSAGRGIEIIEAGRELPKAPLYVKYIKKDQEYRVHIVGGIVTDVQRKIKDPDIKEPKNWQIRSHDNGFIFARNSVAGMPKSVTDEAMKAFNASGLDFGGFDVIVDKRGQSYVLEVNTAIGMDGTTPQIYANAFRKMIGIR